MITIYIKSKTYGVKGIKIDAEDFGLVNKYPWHISKRHKVFYARTRGYNRNHFMHQVIMNFPLGKCIDHIDINGLNNTKKNLRLCTQSQNSCNRPIPSNNTSGYKGVTYYKNRTKNWRCILRIGNKNIFGGYFLTAKEAGQKYNDLALQYHGQFANLNVIK